MVHWKRLLGAGLVVVALAVALGLTVVTGHDSLANGTTIYVDADAASGANDGSSWGDAFTDLQAALGTAVAGSEIWVAAGTYKPTSGTDRAISFQMKNGVAIYGGFAGTETELGQRDWEANETILSGDLAGDDGPDFANNGENSYHVFYHDTLGLDHTAVLDGFTVSGGNANGGPRTDGGGMFNLLSWPALANVTFSGNSAFRGGGMYNEFSSTTLTNCTFSENRAEGTEVWQGRGGGMYNDESSPELTDCTFADNSADVDGGGMYNDLSSPALTDCTFEGNSADASGGGMYNYISSPTLLDVIFSQNEAYGPIWPDDDGGGGMYNGASSPTLTNCIFEGNTAVGHGGGMDNHDESSPALTGCTFLDNSADYYGGGMHNYNESSPTLTNCTFEGNTAGASGGGMENWISHPELVNCTFEGNSATVEGGGMYNHDSHPELVNCTFSDNSATVHGGGMHNSGSSPTLTNCTFSRNSADGHPEAHGGGINNGNYSSPALTNSILWDNVPDQIWNDDSTPAVTHSDIQGGCDTIPGNVCGAGNIDADPLFVDAANGDVHLLPVSPCIDAGDNTAPNLPPHDFEGDPRLHDGDRDGIITVDMGVDEVYEAPPPVIFVDLDATGSSDGTSWVDALTDLQAALTWAEGGVEIWVAAGTYKPTVEHGGTGERFRSLQLKNGVALYGGFDPSAGDIAFEDRDWEANPTILSGDLNGDDGPDFANNGENSYHVFYHPDGTDLDSNAVLNGFTITSANADAAEPHDAGAGIYNDGSSPTLTNCIFAGNSADADGGGMYNYNSAPMLTNCTFAGNSAAWHGGGIYNRNSSPVLTNCTITGNSATTFDGGGMFNRDSSPTLIYSTFSGNSSNSGGGMSNIDSSPTLTGCTFAGNSASNGGGMRNYDDSSPTLTDCTFEGNAAGVRGGGMYNGGYSSPTLTDCTFSGNTAVSEGGGMYNYPSSPELTNCTFAGNSAGVSGGGIYNYQQASPTLTNCTFAGNSAEVSGGGMYNASSSHKLTNSILWGIPRMRYTTIAARRS